MRSHAPIGMSLPGVGTGRCVRVTERAGDAETGSGFAHGAASSKQSPASAAFMFRRSNPLPRRADAGAWHLSPAGGRLPRRNRVAPSDPAVRVGAIVDVRLQPSIHSAAGRGHLPVAHPFPIAVLATMRAAVPLRAGGDTRAVCSPINCAGPFTGAGGFFAALLKDRANGPLVTRRDGAPTPMPVPTLFNTPFICRPSVCTDNEADGCAIVAERIA